MRIRASIGIPNTTLQRRQTAYGGGTSVAGTYYSRTGEWKYMTDVVTPRFKERSGAGEIIINPMSITTHTLRTVQTGYAHTYSNPVPPPVGTIVVDAFDSLLNWKLGPLPWGLGETLPTTILDASAMDSATTRAATAALANWQEADVQSLAFLGELHKTIDLLKNPVASLTKELSKGLKKGFTMSGTLQGASSQYLAWFYGIRTLMFDIEGAKKAIEVMRCKRETARGKADVSAESVQTNLVLHQGSLLADARYKITQRDTYTVRAGLVGDLAELSYARNFGYRLADIPAAAWELTPWSFVGDWLFNFGDFVQSLTVDTSGAKGQWLTTEHRIDYTRQVTSTTLVNPANGWSVTQPCADLDHATYVTKSRVPANLASSRGIAMRADLSRVPVFAALALVTQQILKRK